MTSTQIRPATLIWSRSDWGLLIGGLGLSLIGALLVWSATRHQSGSTYLARHLINTGIGLGLAAAVTRVDFRGLRAYAPWLYVASVAGLVLVLTPLGEDDRQTHTERHLGELRWLDGEPARQPDPRVRAVDRGAERREDKDQPGDRREIEPRGIGPQPSEVHPGDRRRQAKPDAGIEQVTCEVRGSGLVARGGPDQQRSDEGEPEATDEQTPVRTGPDRGGGPGLCRRHAGRQGQVAAMEESTVRQRSTSSAIFANKLSIDSNFSVGRSRSTNSTHTVSP